MKKLPALIVFSLVSISLIPSSYPQSAEEQLLAGEAYFARSNFEEAAGAFNAVLANDPQNAQALSGLGIIFNEVADYDKALTYGLKAVSLNPHDSEVNYRLGIIYGNREDYENSERYLKAALKLDPHFIEAHFNLGVLFWHLDDLNASITHFEKFLAMHPALLTSYYQMGAFESWNLNFLQERKACQKLFPPPLAEAYPFNNLGIAFALSGNYKSAKTFFEKAIDLSPQIAKPYFNLSILLRYLNNTEESLKYFKKASELNSNYHALPRRLINSNGEVLLFDPDIECREKSVSFYYFPGFAEAYYDLGIAYCTQGNKLRAHKQLDELKRFGRASLVADLRQCIDKL